MDSSTSTPVKKHSALRRGLAVAAVIGALGAGAFMLNPTTAYFSATDTGSVNVQTATLSVGLGDNHGSSGTFNLGFNNLKPGETKEDVIRVTNTGSIAADAKIGFTELTGLNFNSKATANQLLVGVYAHQDLTPAPQLARGTIDLGVLQPGETKDYIVQFSLHKDAGNEWQNAMIGATATVTLDQQ